MLDSNATIKLLETLPDIRVQVLNGIQTHDFYVTGAMLSQLSLIKATWEKSFVGLALYVQ